MVLAARDEVEGFGGRAARKSPYAGPSWSLTSARQPKVSMLIRGVTHVVQKILTIDVIALGKVSVMLGGEEVVSISADDAFEVPRMEARHVSWCIHHGHLECGPYPPFTLKKRPSMAAELQGIDNNQPVV